jgi:hypothetical protein
MRSPIFPTVLKVCTDASLRDDLVKAAEAERTTVSEIVRRGLRSALAGRSPAPPNDGEPDPFRPAPGQRIAA